MSPRDFIELQVKDAIVDGDELVHRRVTKWSLCAPSTNTHTALAAEIATIVPEIKCAIPEEKVRAHPNAAVTRVLYVSAHMKPDSVLPAALIDLIIKCGITHWSFDTEFIVPKFSRYIAALDIPVVVDNDIYPRGDGRDLCALRMVLCEF